MKEHEDIYVAVVENHKLDGARGITLMKHMHVHAIMIIIQFVQGLPKFSKLFPRWEPK